MNDDKVTVLPVRKKAEGKPIELVDTSSRKCRHAHVIVDPELAELTCRDCKEKLNPIQYIARVAQGLNGWEYERSMIAKARAEYEERKRCRCTHCGQMTDIRRVSNRELRQITARKIT